MMAGLFGPPDYIRCCCNPSCPCPCCPDCWRRVLSAVGGVLVASAGTGGTDCGFIPGAGSEHEQEIVFSCVDGNDINNNVYNVFVALSLFVRVYCDRIAGNWKVEYKSDATAGEWVESEVTFECPSCSGVEPGGLVTGTFSFVAFDKCSVSGFGDVVFPFNITITITVECS